MSTSRRVLCPSVSKAVSSLQAIIITGIVGLLIMSGFFFLTRSDNTPPVAILSTNFAEVEADNLIQFSAGDSTDNVGITNYRWDFGDGTTGTGEAFIHAYSEAGDFTVTLTVADKAGNEGKDTITIEVLPNDYWPTAEWPTSIPEEQSMNSKKLAQMMEYIDEQGFAIDSVMVVRNGHIVLEEFPNPNYYQDRLHELYSVTKSFTSALIGIAIHEGCLDSVEQKVVDFFPDREISNLDARKQNMTLEHLLIMTSGLEWDEWTYPYTDDRSVNRQMWLSDDPVQFVLDRPMANDPGVEWVYNSGCSILLGEILEQVTGNTTLEFAREYLFKPLGIENVNWARRKGYYNTGGGLSLKPRDMAKLGHLYLDNGTWDGEQIVPSEWVARSTETSFYHSESSGYGYHWWTLPQSGAYYALGLYQQRIYVVPDFDMVVVFTANIREGPDPEPELLHQLICATNEREIYSKYGFSFDYPIGMTIRENDFREESTSEISGVVQFRFEYPLEIINIIWDTVESVPELEAVLDELLAMVESGGTEVNDKGPLVTMVKEDHEMVYQRVNMTEPGLLITGILGSWYCDEVNRIYMFFYMTLPEFVTQQDLLREFQGHLDSLVFH
ncbi:serine hydrolase [Candidatus Bathyarchaeota archaeon]|nr:serine hydrolase [Candidatus Bathyarchaeota archaeon]